MAISISKTSFAMTNLGLVKRWHFLLFWFSILSLNVIMGIDAIFQSTQCALLERTSDAQVEGHCWNSYSLYITPCLRAVSLELFIFLFISPALVSSPPSLVRIDGLCLGYRSLAFPRACADEDTREGRSRDFYEPRRIVSQFLELPDLGSFSPLACNSGITATACIKTAYLPDLGRWTDLTRKMDP